MLSLPWLEKNQMPHSVFSLPLPSGFKWLSSKLPKSQLASILRTLPTALGLSEPSSAPVHGTHAHYTCWAKRAPFSVSSGFLHHIFLPSQEPLRLSHTVHNPHLSRQRHLCSHIWPFPLCTPETPRRDSEKALEEAPLKVKSQLCSLFAEWPWTSSFTFQSLDSLICINEAITTFMITTILL